MVGIASYGAYVPKFLVNRSQIAAAWDFPSVPGTKAVANADEDSLTMGVEAGLDCVKGFDERDIDGVFFASTTSPYLEKSSASIIATTLDLRKDILTTDFANSTRSGTTALAAAADTIAAGKAGKVLVIASDMREPEPMSMYEYAFGDGAAAFLVSGGDDVAIDIIDHVSVSEDLVGPWRRVKDGHVRQMSGKYDDTWYAKNMVSAIKAVLARNGVDPGTVAKAALHGPDPRAPGKVGKAVGISPKSVLDTLFMHMGDTGTPQSFMTLVAGLKRGKDGEIIVLGGHGDGADAILMKVVPGGKDKLKQLKRTRRGYMMYSAMTEIVDTYTKYLFFRNSLGKEPFKRKTSTVTIHRDADFLLRMHGVRCKACDTVQYPKWRSCIEPACMATGNMEDVKLAKRGKIFTFVGDHLEGGDYYETPIPRCVIDLEGGGRVLLNMTDCNPKDVSIGMDVEMTFRKIHEGGEFYNYYWKCRPPRERAGSQEDE